MPLWKQILLGLYYPATCPFRYWNNRRMAARGRAPVMVVLFHRIAYDWANSWTTHTETFVKDIHWLKSRFEMVSLAEAQNRIRRPENHRPCVAVTFDDGYAVNCGVALPLLIEQQIPCTYFVTTENVLEGKPFQHDLAGGTALAELAAASSAKAVPRGSEAIARGFEPNTIAQLREMAAAGIEIGAHTRTHPHLGRIDDPDRLYDEIVAARDDLQDAIGYPVRRFAVPFGQHEHLSEAVFRMCYDSGFDCVVSAYGGYNWPEGDPFHVQRMGVDGPHLRMKNWTTVDPLKLLRIKRFRYSLELAEAAVAEAV